MVGTHKTVQGADLTVSGSGDQLTVNGANVVCGGIKTTNATVYLIDSVLLPRPTRPRGGRYNRPAAATCFSFASLRSAPRQAHRPTRQHGNMPSNLLWFRRDLRLHDLPPLLEAAADGADVLGCFVLDPRLEKSSGRGDCSSWVTRCGP